MKKILSGTTIFTGIYLIAKFDNILIGVGSFLLILGLDLRYDFWREA